MIYAVMKMGLQSGEQYGEYIMIEQPAEIKRCTNLVPIWDEVFPIFEEILKAFKYRQDINKLEFELTNIKPNIIRKRSE